MRLMLSVSFMTATMAVAHLVPVEVLGRAVPSLSRPFAVMWVFAVVAVIRVVMVVNVAMEMLGTVKPWSGTDKDAVSKPLGAVVPVGCAIVRCEIVVPVRATRFWSDIYGDLCMGCPRNAQQNDN